MSHASTSGSGGQASSLVRSSTRSRGHPLIPRRRRNVKGAAARHHRARRAVSASGSGNVPQRTSVEVEEHQAQVVASDLTLLTKARILTEKSADGNRRGPAEFMPKSNSHRSVVTAV